MSDGIGVTPRHQQQRRQHRRGVGGDAEKTDVATLHADVPHIERCADRADPERRRARAIASSFRARPSSRTAGGRSGSEAMSRGRSPRPHRSALRRSGATAPNRRPTRMPPRRRRDNRANTRRAPPRRLVRRSAPRRRQSRETLRSDARVAGALQAAATRTARSAAATGS